MSVHDRKTLREMLIGFVLVSLIGTPVLAGSPGDLKPRVPMEHLAKAQSLRNPLGSSPDIVARGKKLYESRVFCSACHGLEGAGGTSDALTPHGGQSPTNLADAAWQAARTDGEIYWILKHGSHGTDMAPYMPLYLTEEQAWHIVSYIRMFGSM